MPRDGYGTISTASRLGPASKRSISILPVGISQEYSGWKPKLRLGWRAHLDHQLVLILLREQRFDGRLYYFTHGIAR